MTWNVNRVWAEIGPKTHVARRALPLLDETSDNVRIDRGLVEDVHVQVVQTGMTAVELHDGSHAQHEVFPLLGCHEDRTEGAEEDHE